MLTYIVRRLLLMVPTLIGVTMLVFFAMALAPGGMDLAFRSQEGNMRPEEKARIKAYFDRRYGLNKPPIVQYGRWLNQISPLGFYTDEEGGITGFGFKWPDLGESLLKNRRVIDVVKEALPPTLVLNLLTVPIIYVVAVVVGIYAAQYRGKTFDLVSGVGFLALWSMPVMWIGIMLLGYLASVDHLNWFPTSGLHDNTAFTMRFLPHASAGGFQRGWLLDSLWHLILPVVTLTVGGFAFLSKLMRSAVLENLGADFARTARAKGVDERTVLLRHVLRNSLLPLITVAASILPGLLGGSLIVESIFSIQGMGPLMLDAIYTKDRELVLSETLVVGVISLVCLLVADLLYAVADPRVSYE